MVPVVASISITVYSDVICPWCYVGKRRLEAALAEAGPSVTEHISFSWRPFELNPNMPAEGVERSSYRAAKFGEARSAELDRKMAETGREHGIAFAFDRMRRTPNTRLAHRLIWEAGRQGCQDAMVERLFHGYFEEALDIGAAHTLRSFVRECGLDEKGVELALTSEDSLKAVTKLEQDGYSC
jgi:predicted DsbA family dithiol-disulfide isomerase